MTEAEDESLVTMGVGNSNVSSISLVVGVHAAVPVKTKTVKSRQVTSSNDTNFLDCIFLISFLFF
jgi:hypothetical protein